MTYHFVCCSVLQHSLSPHDNRQHQRTENNSLLWCWNGGRMRKYSVLGGRGELQTVTWQYLKSDINETYREQTEALLCTNNFIFMDSIWWILTAVCELQDSRFKVFSSCAEWETKSIHAGVTLIYDEWVSSKFPFLTHHSSLYLIVNWSSLHSHRQTHWTCLFSNFKLLVLPATILKAQLIHSTFDLQDQ